MSQPKLILFFTAVLITCITPGAGVLYTVRNAIRYGKKKAALSPTGNAIGVLLMSLVAASGLGAVIHSSAALFIFLQSAGCLLLGYFGYKSWHAPSLLLRPAAPARESARESASASETTLGSRRESQHGRIDRQNSQNNFGILTGAALLQVTNPMLIVFLLSLLPQFIDENVSYTKQIFFMIGIFVVTCWLVHLAYSYSFAYAADRWMTDRFCLIVNKISAILFWLIALSVLVKLF